MNCPKKHGPMVRGKGFFVCLTCGETVQDPSPQAAAPPESSVIETLPFPVAFPLAHALDPVRCPDAHNRFDNMIFAASQALRLTALLLLSDYFESTTTCPKLDTHIRSLRMPHWENWSGLARSLSKFWVGHENDKPERPCHFDWLPKAWLEVACTTIESSRWQDALRSIPGKSGQAVSVNDAFQKARNDAHHRLTTHSAGSAKACEAALGQLLPLLMEACALLFPQDKLALLRRHTGDPSRCIRLVGTHLDKRFATEPVPQFADSFFLKSEVVAVSGSNCVPLHPLVVPIDPDLGGGDPFEVELLEPATLLDQAKEREVILLGVEKWWVKEDYAKPFLEAIQRKQIGLGLSGEETRMWTLAPWSIDNAKANLAELTGKKYFPDCYVDRRGVDDVFNLCLQGESKGLLLIGEAGSGKSSLLCRLVERLTGSPSSSGPELSQKNSEKHKPQNLESYLKFHGANDAVIFLSGRAAFGGDAHLAGSALLCEAVLQKAGIAPGAFDSLEKWASTLNASVRDDTVPRKVWLILDALNEADRFEDLLTALDKFLPNLPRFPWLKLILSIRSGAYRALNRRHADLARAGASFLENEHYFFALKSRDSDKIVPYLEVKPFEMEEAALAHQLRQQRFPATSVKAAWIELSEPIRELLINPLHLHLFHETFGSSSVHPDDLDADALLNAYLDHLCGQNPGLERTLQQIGTLIFQSRVPALPVATADAWLDEWRLAGSVAGRSAKLNPIEELVSASLLLRPAEHGIGMNRQLAAFQFRHQKLCEQVLLRELRRQIHPRKLPTGEELNAWVQQIVGLSEDAKKPFNELLGAVQSMLKDVILAGAVDVFAALSRVEPEAFRTRVILGGLLKSHLDRREETLEVFLRNLKIYLTGSCAIAETVLDAIGYCLDELETRSMSILASRFWETFLAINRSLVDAEPHRAGLRLTLSVAHDILGRLAETKGDSSTARKFFEEALAIKCALVDAEPHRSSFRLGLAESLHHLGDLAQNEGDSRTARKFFEESFTIKRSLLALEPHRSSFRLGLAESLNRLGGLAQTEGDSLTAQKFFKEALAIKRALIDAEPHCADLRRNLAVSLDHLGGLAQTEGDSLTARKFFEEALAINRALVDAEPHRADLRPNFAVSLNRLGDLAETKGDSLTARKFFEEALAIERALVDAEPHRADLRRNLSISLRSLGGLAQTEGDSQTARKLFEEALAINRALVDAEPHRADLRGSLSASLDRLGKLAQTEGDSQTARKFFKKALAIERALVDAEPHRADLRRNLAVSLRRLGNLAQTEGDSQTARKFFKKALAIDRALVDAEPHRADLRGSLSASLDRLGKLAQTEGDSQTARKLFEEALAIDRALVDAEPHRADLRRNLAESLDHLGTLAETEGDSQTARKFFEEALAIDRALVAAEPQVFYLKENLCISLGRLADIREKEGDSRTASALLRESLQIKRELLAQTGDDPDLTDEIMDLEHRIKSLQ